VRAMGVGILSVRVSTGKTLRCTVEDVASPRPARHLGLRATVQDAPAEDPGGAWLVRGARAGSHATAAPVLRACPCPPRTSAGTFDLQHNLRAVSCLCSSRLSGVGRAIVQRKVRARPVAPRGELPIAAITGAIECRAPCSEALPRDVKVESAFADQQHCGATMPQREFALQPQLQGSAIRL
jgi:hypothetical protein